ncbi:MAG: hypothetical protein ABIZ91_13570 [Gemmatimonadaceae bacterium]
MRTQNSGVPRSPCRRRNGVALLATLVALFLISILIVAVLRVATIDARAARDAATMLGAANAAESGAYAVMRDWAGRDHESLRVGDILGPDTLQNPLARSLTRTMRISSTTFWTVSEGEAGDSVARTLARRATNVAFRLAIPDVLIAAALTVRDSLTLAGGARVVGIDTTTPAANAFCSHMASPAGVAVAMPDTSRLCDGTCGSGSVSGRALGVPPLLRDSASADSARYLRFGAEQWSTLTTHAAVILAPSSVITAAPALTPSGCDRTRNDNWGDPSGAGPCGSYAPLIWARGDIELRGGAGQGVLLADGDVTLSAGATFAGVVITRDDLRSAGIGGTILGAVLAADERVSAGDHSRLDGATLVQRSHCAVVLALERSARLLPVRGRAWAPLR